MADNFKCKNCTREFYIPQYSLKYVNGVEVFSTKSGKLTCPHCSSEEVEFIKKEGLDLSSISYSSYSSASPEKKKEILQKRANDHKKKTSEQYKTIDREFRGVCNPKHY